MKIVCICWEFRSIFAASETLKNSTVFWNVNFFVSSFFLTILSNTSIKHNYKEDHIFQTLEQWFVCYSHRSLLVVKITKISCWNYWFASWSIKTAILNRPIFIDFSMEVIKIYYFLVVYNFLNITFWKYGEKYNIFWLYSASKLLISDNCCKFAKY